MKQAERKNVKFSLLADIVRLINSHIIIIIIIINATLTDRQPVCADAVASLQVLSDRNRRSLHTDDGQNQTTERCFEADNNDITGILM